MIAENLAAYIKEKGYKQRAIAVKAGLSDGEMSRILTGRAILKADVFARICDALEEPMDAFSNKEAS